MNIPWDDWADALAAGDEDAAENARDRLALLGGLLLAEAVRRQGAAVLAEIDKLGVPPAVWAAIEQTTGGTVKLCEWLTVEVRRLKAENWELARTLARLEMRVEQLEGERDGVAQGCADVEGQGDRAA